MYKIGKKFHGMTIVDDLDNQTVKGNDVLEMTSGGSCVFRSYDKHGNLIESSEYEIDLLGGIHNGVMTESNCTKSIKEQLGKAYNAHFFISESVVRKIIELAS